MYKEVASAAAKWWKGQLASNSKSKYNHIIQEDHPMFILYYLCQEKYSGQVLNQFYVELKKRIEKELEEKDELILYSHYYPCPFLESVGNICGILGLSFPTFVEMIITRTSVKVKFMDKKHYTILYQKPEEE